MNLRPSRLKASLTRTPVALLAVLGAGWSAMALGRMCARRVPLREVLGLLFAWVCVALAVAFVASVAVFVREILAASRGRIREHPFAPWRAFFVAGIATWIAFFLLVHPAERLWIEAGGAMPFGIFAVAMLLEPVFARLPAPVRKWTDLCCFSLCASALLLELSLRTIAVVYPTQVLSRFGDMPEEVVRRMRFQPGEVVLGFRCNSTGHYDDEFRRREKGERLVVTIGDSFSVGIVPHDYHFTTVCERLLGVPIANMGISSTGPPEYLRMLVDEAVPLDPDLVVIDIFVGNDLVNDMETRARSLTFVRDWLDRRSVLLWLVPRRLATMAEERRRLAREGPIGTAPGADVLAATVVDAASMLKSLPWLADPSLERASFSEANFRGAESRRARNTCSAGSAELHDLFQAMLAMKRSAAPIPVCVMLIPDEFQVEDAVWNDVLADTAGAILDRDHPQKMLLPWFESNGFEVLDLLPALRAVPPMADGRGHLYHLRDTHFNARGNKVTGEALAEFLRARLAKPNR